MIATILKVFPEGGVSRTEMFDPPIIKVGTLPSSHLKLDDPNVSRMHAVIEATDDGVFVIDLGSIAGTIVNDRKINKRALVVGDRLVFGSTIVEVVQLSVTAKASVAPPAKRTPKVGELWATPEGARVEIQGDKVSVNIRGRIEQRLRARTWPGQEQVYVDADSITFISDVAETATAIGLLAPIVAALEAVGQALGEWAKTKDHGKVAGAVMAALPKEITDAIDDLVLHGVLASARVVGSPPKADEAVAPAVGDGEIELRITDQAFEPSYGGWNIQFSAVGAPRLSHQNTDPSLEAFVKLQVVDTSRQLTSGYLPTTGAALQLVRDEGDEVSRHAVRPLTGTAEGNILATGFGAASVDTGGARDVPIAMPSDEEVLAAMKRSLEVHLGKVREERARLKVTESGAGFVGRSFKVKT